MSQKIKDNVRIEKKGTLTLIDGSNSKEHTIVYFIQ